MVHNDQLIYIACKSRSKKQGTENGRGPQFRATQRREGGLTRTRTLSSLRGSEVNLAPS